MGGLGVASGGVDCLKRVVGGLGVASGGVDCLNRVDFTGGWATTRCGGERRLVLPYPFTAVHDRWALLPS